LPLSTAGEALALLMMYFPPMYTNGMAPLLLEGTYGGASYLASSACWAAVGVCSGV
jgi:hypothetical protein